MVVSPPSIVELGCGLGLLAVIALAVRGPAPRRAPRMRSLGALIVATFGLYGLGAGAWAARSHLVALGACAVGVLSASWAAWLSRGSDTRPDGGGANFIVMLPRAPGAGGSVNPCIGYDELSNTTVRCELTTPEQREAGVQALARAGREACSVKAHHFIGMTLNHTDYIEIACTNGRGYMIETDNSGKFKSEIDCDQASGIGGGCTLTKSTKPLEHEHVTGVNWTGTGSTPIGQELTPAAAWKRDVRGWVLLGCTAGPELQAQDCAVIVEHPRGWGFGDAALQASRQSQAHSARNYGGALPKPGVTFKLPIFFCPDKDRGCQIALRQELKDFEATGLVHSQ